MAPAPLTPHIDNVEEFLSHCHRRRYPAKSTIIYAGDQGKENEKNKRKKGKKDQEEKEKRKIEKEKHSQNKQKEQGTRKTEPN